MIKITINVALLYHKYWWRLGAISALLTLVKLGDLVVPLLAGNVLESVETDSLSNRTFLWLAVAIAVWIVHGNVLPWLYNMIDAQKVDLFARRDLSLWSLGRVMGFEGQDTSLLQTIIERGESVIPDFVVGVTRVLLPMLIPGVAVTLALVVISPRLFLALAFGCSLYGALTIYMNRKLMPQYTDLQNLDNRREQMRIRLFRALAEPASCSPNMIEDYGLRYAQVAKAGSEIRACYLNFDLSRGVLINLMNACSWIIGIHAVRSGQFGLAVFIAFVSWSTACISYVQAATGFHKQWLEIGPAIRNYLSIVAPNDPIRRQSDIVKLKAIQPAE